MITNAPQTTESGINIYGYHSNFEILRVDDKKATIFSTNIDPKQLRIGDAVFYGLSGSYWEVVEILSIRDNVVDAKVKRFKNLPI
jgi:hypothetical protein